MEWKRRWKRALDILLIDSISCCFNLCSYSAYDWLKWPLLPNGLAFSSTLRPAANRYQNVTGLRQVHPSNLKFQISSIGPRS